MTHAHTILKTYGLDLFGNKYIVVVATGIHNYIAISKLTNNPFLTLGKQFKNFDEAARNYKSPEMKTELLKIEMELVTPVIEKIVYPLI